MAEAIYANFLGGAQANISPLLQESTQPSVVCACRFDHKFGAVTKDVGYSRVGDVIQANKSITGLYHFIQSPTVNKVLATANIAAGTNLQLKYNNAGTWTNIDVGSTWDAFEDCKVEMVGFIGYCFFVGYDSTDNVFLPVASLTGTTFSTATNVTGMPQGKYVIRYRDRIYVINSYYGATAYPFRVCFSSVPVAGAITWTVASDFFDVDFGYELTGAGENWDKMVLFTDYDCYFYDQSSLKKAFSIGCSAHRTIKNYGQYMVWANGDGVWLSTGGQPQNIASPVMDFIRGATPRNFFAEVIDEEYILHVGNVTVNGYSYTNVELHFNFVNSSWWWREDYNSMTCFAKYNDSGVIRRYMGDTVGTVWDKAKYTDTTLISADGVYTAFAGYDISSILELPPMHLGTLDTEKALRKLTAYAERAQGVTLQGRVLDRNTRVLTPYKPIGKLNNFITTFDINLDKGVLLQLMLTETSKNPYWSFYGVSLDINKFSKINKTK